MAQAPSEVDPSGHNGGGGLAHPKQSNTPQNGGSRFESERPEREKQPDDWLAGLAALVNCTPCCSDVVPTVHGSMEPHVQPGKERTV